MVFPRSHAWTPLQKWLIAGAVAISLISFLSLVYTYERYYRGPHESVFVGAWRGEAGYTGDQRIAYRFKADHTYDEDLGLTEPAGQWYAGGEFLYLRQHYDDLSVSVPYNTLQVWHVDSITQSELRMHEVDWRLHAVLKRVE